MNRKNRSRLALLTLATALGLTACSSSSSSPGASTDAAIRVMTVGIQTPTASFGGIAFPYGATGVQAAAAAINATGGIDGHKIRVDVCDTKGDPNISAQCGRTAASNGDVAVVGTFDPIGAAQLVAVLQAEHIPYIGGLPTAPAEFTSPVSFQFDPGALLGSTALVQLWSDSGCKNVAAIAPANPGNNTVATEQQQIGKKVGITVHTQLITPGLADVTPSLSTALASKPDCFTYNGDGQTNVKYILGLRQLGYTGKIITSSGSLTPQFVKILGPAANGILILNSTLQPTSDDPMVKDFMTDLGTYLKGSQQQIAINANEFAQDGWSSVQLVKQALTGAKTFTAATLLAKIPTLCDVNVGNVYPHVDFCKPVVTTSLTPRLYNDEWQYFVIKNGQFVSVGGTWHNMDSTVPGA
jgi:branched-chain amino acid transport system substrate-binding protein